MKKLLIAIAIALPIALSSGAAQASPTTTTASGAVLSKKETQCQKAKRQGKACQITFGVGDDVEGGTSLPNGSDVYTQIDALFGGLIDIRADFIDYIVAAADDI